VSHESDRKSTYTHNTQESSSQRHLSPPTQNSQSNMYMGQPPPPYGSPVYPQQQQQMYPGMGSPYGYPPQPGGSPYGIPPMHPGGMYGPPGGMMRPGMPMHPSQMGYPPQMHPGMNPYGMGPFSPQQQQYPGGPGSPYSPYGSPPPTMNMRQPSTSTNPVVRKKLNHLK
jgi:hypothetical protein